MLKSVAGVMHEFKHGELHSGSPKGPVVHSRAQAIAIAMSEQRQQGHGAAVKHEIAKRHAAHHDPHHSTR